jgi:hypothetical protein
MGRMLRTRAPVVHQTGDSTSHAWTILMKKSRERENANSVNRISNTNSGSRQHNYYKANGRSTRDRLPTNQHLCLDHTENTATLCAQQAGHSITPQPTFYATGPHSAAQHEQGATGQRTKCGKRWCRVHTDQQPCPKQSSILPRKSKRNFERTNRAWFPGTTSKTTHPHN